AAARASSARPPSPAISILSCPLEVCASGCRQRGRTPPQARTQQAPTTSRALSEPFAGFLCRQDAGLNLAALFPLATAWISHQGLPLPAHTLHRDGETGGQVPYLSLWNPMPILEAARRSRRAVK